MKPFYEDKITEMEVYFTKRVIKSVRGRGEKLTKKPVEVRKIMKKEKHVAIVKDSALFLKHVTEMRNILPAGAKYRVCQDGGGGSLKSVVSVTDKTVNPKMESKGEMLSGVNRVLPLAVCPGVPERHYDLRQIMEHLKLHIIPNITMVMDLCLRNAILSISSHGGKYACSFCSGPCTLKSGP